MQSRNRHRSRREGSEEKTRYFARYLAGRGLALNPRSLGPGNRGVGNQEVSPHLL